MDPADIDWADGQHENRPFGWVSHSWGLTINTVVVPYVVGRLHPETEQWANKFGAALHELSSDHDSYWKALVGWWNLPGDLVVVEQDVVPAVDAVAQMVECPQLWCSSPYGVLGSSRSRTWVTYDGITSVRHRPPRVLTSQPAVLRITDGLGCVKFSDRFKRSFPDSMVQAGEPRGDRRPHGYWGVTDTRLSKILRANGQAPHLHERSIHRRRYGPVRASSPS